MLKALLIDFDGLVIDSESVWYDLYHEVLLRDYDYDLSIKDFLVCVGASSFELFEFLSQNISEEVDIEKLKEETTKKFIEESKEIEIMPGVREIIEQAKKLGLKTCIASSASRPKPEYHLTRFELINQIDEMSTGDLSERLKPAPDIYIKATELLNLEPSECLALEDSKNGLISATAAGIKCIIIPNRITELSEFSGYYKKYYSLNEINLEEIIEEFNE